MPIKRYSIGEIMRYFGVNSYHTWYKVIAPIAEELEGLYPVHLKGKNSKRYTIPQVVLIKSFLKDLLEEIE